MKLRDALLLALVALIVGFGWTVVGLLIAAFSAFPLESGPSRPATWSAILAFAPLAGTVLLLGAVLRYATDHPGRGLLALLAFVLCLVIWLAAAAATLLGVL